MNQKGFVSIVLAIVVTAILAVGGTYYYNTQDEQNKVQTAITETASNLSFEYHQKIEELEEKIESLEINLTEAEKERQQITDKNKYVNNKLGFSIIFPEAWADYIASASVDGVVFGLEPQDDLFVVGAYNHADWDALLVLDGPKPKYIDKNSDYVFAYSQGHDTVDELIDAARMIPDIIATFQFLDNDDNGIDNLNTYINDSYNYSIDYPSDWQFSEGQGNKHITFLVNDNASAIFNLSVVDPFTRTLAEWSDGILSDNDTKENITFNGLEAVKINFADGPHSPGAEEYAFVKDGVLYRLIFSDAGNIDDQTMQQMLTSFKFLDDESAWRVYDDPSFFISYPSDWSAGKMDVEDMYILAFRPKNIHGDFQWGIFIYDALEKNQEELIADMGKQFLSERQELRNNVQFNGIDATEVVVTTTKEGYEDWFYKAIIFEYVDKIFMISNGAIKDEKFEDFYKSFELK